MDNKVELVLYSVIAFVILNILAIGLVVTKHFAEGNTLSFSFGETLKTSAEDATFRNIVNMNSNFNAKGRDGTNSLNINPEYNTTTFLIHEPEEFDYKSRNNVFATRMKIMKSYQNKDKEFCRRK